MAADTRKEMNMRFLNAALLFTATSLVAQEPPYPASAPRTPSPVAAPYAAPRVASPIAPAAPFAQGRVPSPAAPYAVVAPTPPAGPTPAMAPMAPLPGEPEEWHFSQGQGRGIDRSEAQRIAELGRQMAREQADRTREMAQEQARMAREMALEQNQRTREIAQEQAQRARELAQVDREFVRAQADAQREMAREMALQGRTYVSVNPIVAPNVNVHINPPVFSMGAGFGAGHGLPELPPHSWAQNDPADSLWKLANEVMSRGDYRRAATVFKEIPAKHPYSAYAADAMYWNAHALYRVGGTPDLQEALQVLETLKQKFPNTRLRNRGQQTDVAALQTRIAGVLSQRGQGGSDIVKRALAENSTTCDVEEQQVRTAALSALMQTDPNAAMDYAIKVLGRKDDCSRDLRRNAIFMLGEKHDPKASAALIAAAKSDASPDVRQTAVQYLGRMGTDDALAALEELAKASDEQGIQRSAVQALARNSNPRARAGIKALIERNDVNESLRISALDGLDQERATQEDVDWLQKLYAKTDSPRIRARIINAIGRLGGGQNEKWFVTLANNENETIDVRLEAVRRAGQAMDINALGRLYDQTGQRQLRDELVRQLGNRREPESIDKLAEIAKNGTDPQVRMGAIRALQNKKDDRATKVLLGLIDKPEKE
jgi:HEAT repeat protein/TolA-binding protein